MHRRTKRIHWAEEKQTGFTVLELLIVMSLISLVIAVVLPALGSAREAARRLQCTNNLKQIGLAIHSYHEQHTSLPIGCQWEASFETGYGLCIGMLPHLEQTPLYETIDRTQLLSSPINNTARQTSLPVFICPSDIVEQSFMLIADDEADIPFAPLVSVPTSTYIGVFGTVEPDEDHFEDQGDGPFPNNCAHRFRDLQRGLTNTFLIGERTMKRVPSTWLGFDRRADDALCRILGHARTTPNCETCHQCEFSSRHYGGANFLWADGRVGFVSNSIDSQQYRIFATRY
jgi:prepilin-type processing-associated H-X9-DG protein/prepilin-type N-terminal cleavage/methylation domain-containing protein